MLARDLHKLERPEIFKGVSSEFKRIRESPSHFFFFLHPRIMPITYSSVNLNKQEVREDLVFSFPVTKTSGGIKPESFVTKIIFSADSSGPGCKTLLMVPGKRAGDDLGLELRRLKWVAAR